MNFSWSTGTIRTGMVVAWLAIIVIFLALPAFYKYLIPHDKSFTIFVSPLMIDPKYVKKFEEEAGIKVHLTYIESSAALLSKFEMTKGHGFDLILADDHATSLLIKRRLVKKIDKARVVAYNDLKPTLHNNYYDATNEYTIPYYLAIYGIAYNTNVLDISTLNPAMQVMFDPEYLKRYRVCMVDDAKELCLMASYYLYRSVGNFKDPVVCEAVKNLLSRQKRFIDVYSLYRADYLLLTKSCDAAMLINPDYWRLKRHVPWIAFLVPPEGAFMSIDSFVIPKKTAKDDVIYQFINFMFRPENITHHVRKYGFCSPLKTVQLEGENPPCPTQYPNTPFLFFNDAISDKQASNLWIDVLAE